MLKTNHVFLEEPIPLWAFNEQDFHLLYMWYDLESVDWDASDSEGRTLLLLVSECGFVDIVEKLIELGASTDGFDG